MTAVSNLVEAAQHSGRLRLDITAADLTAAVAQLARPLPGTAPGGNDRFAHRRLDMLFDGLTTYRHSKPPNAAARGVAHGLLP